MKVDSIIRKPSPDSILAKRRQISALIEPIAETSEDCGSVCGRLTYLAHDLFVESALNADGLSDVYDAQAMLVGAMKCGEATPAQAAIIAAALPLIDEYIRLLDRRGSNAARPSVATSAPMSLAEAVPEAAGSETSQLNARQLNLVLESIAIDAQVLLALTQKLNQETAPDPDDYIGSPFYVVGTLVERISMIAEMAIRDCPAGSTLDWMMDENFRAEVAA